MKHVVLYVGHLYKPFWTKKIDRVCRGRSKMVKIWSRMGLCYLHFWLQGLLEAPKWVKDPGYGPQMASPNFPTASKTFFSLEFDLFFFACFDSEGFKAFKFLLTSFFFPLFHCFNSLFVRFSGGSPRLWASALEFLSALLEG